MSAGCVNPEAGLHRPEVSHCTLVSSALLFGSAGALVNWKHHPIPKAKAGQRIFKAKRITGLQDIISQSCFSVNGKEDLKSSKISRHKLPFIYLPGSFPIKSLI